MSNETIDHPKIIFMLQEGSFTIKYNYDEAYKIIFNHFNAGSCRAI